MPSKSTNYVLALAGPTAVGKTELAISLAQRLDTEIISADSRQVYKEMIIGTAKPRRDQLDTVKHHLIGTKHIGEPYSAGIFAREAKEILDELFDDRDVVIVTGGTGLYYRALLDGLDPMPKVPRHIRQHWEAVYGDRGIIVLQEKLKESDPEYYRQVDLNNPQRLIRALSIIDATGQPFSHFRNQTPHPRNFEAVRIFLNRPRQELYQRINARVDKMMDAGLLAEVQSLVPLRKTGALQTVGYSELFRYLDGDWSLEEAVDKIKQHTRNYAKRQVTWFRNQGGWVEVCPPDEKEVVKIVTSIWDC